MYDVFSDPIGHELHVQSHLIYADFIEEAGKEFTAKCIRESAIKITSNTYVGNLTPNYIRLPMSKEFRLYIPNNILNVEFLYRLDNFVLTKDMMALLDIELIKEFK